MTLLNVLAAMRGKSATSNASSSWEISAIGRFPYKGRHREFKRFSYSLSVVAALWLMGEVIGLDMSKWWKGRAGYLKSCAPSPFWSQWPWNTQLEKWSNKEHARRGTRRWPR